MTSPLNRDEVLTTMVVVLTRTPIPPPLFRTLGELEAWWRRYVSEVYIPACVGSRDGLAAMVATLRHGNLLLADACGNPDGIFHSMDRFLVQSQAVISGLLFLADMDLHRKQKNCREIAPISNRAFSSASMSLGSSLSGGLSGP